MPILFGKTKTFGGLMRDKTAAATAQIAGSPAHRTIHGRLWLYPARGGSLVVAEVFGLPQGEKCAPGFFSLHIHEGGSCTGNQADPFADAGSHFNPAGCPHPAHAGDLPPLLADNGYAWLACYTDRFTPEQVVGKTVIVHAKPDDFKTQPSGGAGDKIACGQIRGLG